MPYRIALENATELGAISDHLTSVLQIALLTFIFLFDPIDFSECVNSGELAPLFVLPVLHLFLPFFAISTTVHAEFVIVFVAEVVF